MVVAFLKSGKTDPSKIGSLHKTYVVLQYCVCTGHDNKTHQTVSFSVFMRINGKSNNFNAP